MTILTERIIIFKKYFIISLFLFHLYAMKSYNWSFTIMILFYHNIGWFRGEPVWCNE